MLPIHHLLLGFLLPLSFFDFCSYYCPAIFCFSAMYIKHFNTLCFLILTFNTMMRMISGKRYWGDDSEVGDVEEASKFREMTKELMKLAGANNPAEFLPILRWYDLDHLEKKLKAISVRFDRFLQGLVDEHRSGNTSGSTLISHLSTLQKSQPEY